MYYTCIETYKDYFTSGKVYEIEDIGHEILIKEIDNGEKEVQFPYPYIEKFIIGRKTGLGHQYKNEERAINCCNSHLEDAFGSLRGFGNPDIELLRMEILKLQNRCHELSYSAREKSKLNQD